MIPSVTIDSSLRIRNYNEAFVANVIPEKITLGYNILEHNVGFSSVLKKPASMRDFERVLAELN